MSGGVLNQSVQHASQNGRFLSFGNAIIELIEQIDEDLMICIDKCDPSLKFTGPFY